MLPCRSLTALVAALALLFASFSQAHLHLCFDGQEPLAAVHADDDVDHHEEFHHAGEVDSHDDIDVSVAGQALAKAFQFELPVFGPVADYSIAAVYSPDSADVPPLALTFNPPPAPHWRPPLRAPPV